VRTDILNDPGRDGGVPVITRSVAGLVGRNTNTLDLAFTPLQVPESRIELSSPLPQLLSSAVAAMRPEVAPAAHAVAAVIDESLAFIGEQITKAYGRDPFSATVVELLPSHYYTIDVDTQQVRPRKAFFRDLRKYLGLIRRYRPLAARYNQALSEYSLAYRTWQAEDPLGMNQRRRAEVTALYNERLKPAIEDRLVVERELERFTLHRMALMATNMPPGAGCEDAGWQGPWRLHLYVFLGARQTNLWGIDYCVRDPETYQDLDVLLVPNQFDGTNFRPGGVMLEAFLGRRGANLGFNRAQGAMVTDRHSAQTGVFSWNETALVSEEGDGIAPFLLPFEVQHFRQTLADERRAAQDERLRERIDRIDKGVSDAMSLPDSVLESSGSEDNSPSSDDDGDAVSTEAPTAAESLNAKAAPST
jgi:hypothetical protein